MNTVGKVDLGASSGAEGWKDVLQLLKEQNKKMEKLARALSVIQKGMLRNNPGFVKDSVNEAAEVLGGMLNTHRCLLESGVELQKKLERPTPPRKKWVSSGDRALRLWETPQKRRQKVRSGQPPPPLRKELLRGGKAARHRRMQRWPRARPQLKMGTGKWSPKRKKRKKW